MSPSLPIYPTTTSTAPAQGEAGQPAPGTLECAAVQGPVASGSQAPSPQVNPPCPSQTKQPQRRAVEMVADLLPADRHEEVSKVAEAQTPTIEEADALYEQYGKPLEPEHTGEYVAISPDGKSVVGKDLDDVLDRAEDQLGVGHFVFKVGGPSVYKWL